MSISVTRTTVVRVHHSLDTVGCQQLDRILADLIDNQGISELILDLSRAGPIDVGLEAVLDQTRKRLECHAGTLELRTPPEPTVQLLDMADDIPVFAPIDQPAIATEG